MEDRQYQTLAWTYADFESFNFADLQQLHVIGEWIQEAILVIKLDVKALLGLRMYYQNLRDRDEIPAECSEHLPPFLEKVQSVDQLYKDTTDTTRITN